MVGWLQKWRWLSLGCTSKQFQQTEWLAAVWHAPGKLVASVSLQPPQVTVSSKTPCVFLPPCAPLQPFLVFGLLTAGLAVGAHNNAAVAAAAGDAATYVADVAAAAGALIG